MTRRIHVPRLVPGNNPLDQTQAHHVLNVLRLTEGTAVEVFDDQGATAAGVLMLRERGSAMVRVDGEIVRSQTHATITIASAVPKGDRADWMVEKLSELGVAEWIPLAAERSVVLPEGKGKHDRWVRISTEAAKQSQRAGVMKVGTLTKLQPLLASRSTQEATPGAAWCLSTEAAEPVFANALAAELSLAPAPLTIFVGPEGGWAPTELTAFTAAAIPMVRLTTTVLRVETAAVAAAAVVAAALASRA